MENFSQYLINLINLLALDKIRDSFTRVYKIEIGKKQLEFALNTIYSNPREKFLPLI